VRAWFSGPYGAKVTAWVDDIIDQVQLNWKSQIWSSRSIYIYEPNSTAMDRDKRARSKYTIPIALQDHLESKLEAFNRLNSTSVENSVYTLPPSQLQWIRELKIKERVKVSVVIKAKDLNYNCIRFFQISKLLILLFAIFRISSFTLVELFNSFDWIPSLSCRPTVWIPFVSFLCFCFGYLSN
jgi:hypothetical protein